LLDEVIALFEPVPAGWVLDATLGGGGHSAALLESRPDLRILGVDQDTAALDAARKRLSGYGDRVEFRHARFDELGAIVDGMGLEGLSGALFDLGVSSHQIDTAERGFSYRFAGPLDMRMDRSRQLTAEVVVNTYSKEALAAVLTEHGDVRAARRVADAIVRRRPLNSTSDLLDAALAGTPARERYRSNPAKKVFQAIRIEVNSELDALTDALDQTIDRLVFGGRAIVLSYHSGEDRIVKERFRRAVTGGCGCPPQLPCVCGAVSEGVLVAKAVKASAEEVDANPRSSSVRLRALERRQAS
jgi:16S rRNA (cytosine1402-N4)-methyltransferase